MNIEELIQECLKQLKSKKSENTVRAYADGLNVFAEYMGDRELTSQAFIDFPSYIVQKYDNKRTAQNREAAVNYFRGWLVHNRHLKWTPEDVVDYKFAKQDAFSEREFHKPKVAPESVIVASLEAVKAMDVYYPIEATRNEAILLLMHSSGIRVSEVAALNVEDIDLDEGKVFVRKAKGKKKFFSPISPDAVKAIRKYWDERRWLDEKDLPAFGRHDKQSSKNHLRYGAGGIQRMVARLREEMNLPDGILTPHKYRHSAGTRITKQYGIHVAQKWLHHENIDTTKGYVDIGDEDILDIAKQMYARPGTPTVDPSE